MPHQKRFYLWLAALVLVSVLALALALVSVLALALVSVPEPEPVLALALALLHRRQSGAWCLPAQVSLIIEIASSLQYLLNMDYYLNNVHCVSFLMPFNHPL